MKRLFLIAVFSILVLGCKDKWEEERAVTLNDNRFNGKFLYEYKVEGLYEKYEKLEINFDKTNQAIFYHSIKNYNYTPIGGVWEIWSDYGTIKFEVKDNKYRIATWFVTGNSESDFTNWEPYNFSGNGNTLVLENYSFKINRTRDYTLTKQ